MSFGKPSLYEVYCQAYGKVLSGTKLTNSDYYHPQMGGSLEMEEREKVAVSLAVQDVKMKAPMKSTREFEEEMKRLLP